MSYPSFQMSTDFLIRIEHPNAYSKDSLIQILHRNGISGCKVTVLDQNDPQDFDDPRNYCPYIAY